MSIFVVVSVSRLYIYGCFYFEMPKTTKRPRRPRNRTTCAICLENVRKEAKLSGCRHRYCMSCIKRWSKENNKCPQCRKSFEWIRCGRRTFPVESPRKGRHAMVDFIVFLINNFFYNDDFRQSMSNAIERSRNENAMRVFDLLYSLVHRLDLFDLEEPEEAWSWLSSTYHLRHNVQIETI